MRLEKKSNDKSTTQLLSKSFTSSTLQSKSLSERLSQADCGWNFEDNLIFNNDNNNNSNNNAIFRYGYSTSTTRQQIEILKQEMEENNTSNERNAAEEGHTTPTLRLR